MNPKTFRVVIFQPFGPEMRDLLNKDSYTFCIHANDPRDALNWVSQVFPGIEVHGKSDRDYRVGWVDQVNIIDCDELKKFGFEKGKRVPLETPEGYFRRSSEEVADSLLKVINKLSRDYDRCLSIVEYSSRMLKKFGTEHYLKQIDLANNAAQFAKVWMENLMKEYQSIKT